MLNSLHLGTQVSGSNKEETLVWKYCFSAKQKDYFLGMILAETTLSCEKLY